jgi:hypothetical protein
MQRFGGFPHAGHATLTPAQVATLDVAAAAIHQGGGTHPDDPARHRTQDVLEVHVTRHGVTMNLAFQNGIAGDPGYTDAQKLLALLEKLAPP